MPILQVFCLFLLFFALSCIKLHALPTLQCSPVHFRTIHAYKSIPHIEHDKLWHSSLPFCLHCRGFCGAAIAAGLECIHVWPYPLSLCPPYCLAVLMKCWGTQRALRLSSTTFLLPFLFLMFVLFSRCCLIFVNDYFVLYACDVIWFVMFLDWFWCIWSQ